MKTAISLPDELFRKAEAMAARLGIPRSRLYAQALGEYLETHEPVHVTKALDAVYSDMDSALDPAVATAQATAVEEEHR